MIQKKFAISGVIVITISCVLYLFANLKSPANQSIVEPDSVRSFQSSGNPQRVLENRNSAEAEAIQSNAELTENSAVANKSEGDAESTSFLSSEVFSSPEAINKAFVRSDGVIERESLTQVFQHENFTDVVNSLKNAGHDSISANRETLLSQHLMTVVGSEVFQVDYSCSGDICAVTLQSVDDVSPESISNIAEFDTNYSFTSKTVNDLGETTVNAIYIATDDPSTLSITP